MHDMSTHAVPHGAPTASFASMSSAPTTKLSASSITRWPWSLPSSECSFPAHAHPPGIANFAIPGLHLLSSTGAPGDIMTPEYYLQLMTCTERSCLLCAHHRPVRRVRQFLFAHPNRRRRHAFPHFNMMSFWVTFAAFLPIVARFCHDGPPWVAGRSTPH